MSAMPTAATGEQKIVVSQRTSAVSGCTQLTGFLGTASLSATPLGPACLSRVAS